MFFYRSVPGDHSLRVELDVLVAAADVEGVERLQVIPLHHLQALDAEPRAETERRARDDALVDEPSRAEEEEVRELRTHGTWVITTLPGRPKEAEVN